jgi:drug/metabolite transporter (DMT)-like permease
MPHAETRRGLAITAVGGMMLTIDIPLIRLADGNVWSILAVRSGATVIVALVAWVVYRLATGRRLRLIPGKGGLAVAGLYSLSALAFITAVFHTSTANLVFILAFNTVFAAILSWIFLKERPMPQTLLAMAAMIVGVVIIVWDGVSAGHAFGNLMALSSAFLMASAITASRWLRRDMGFTPLVANAVPAVIALFFVSHTGMVIADWRWIILDGFVVIPLSFWCLATGPKYISAPEVAMFYLLETILAPVWVWLIFDEVPSSASLIGGIIMVTALIAHSAWQIANSHRSALARTARRTM